MKYIKIVIGIVAILLIVFLAAGMIKPKASYECEILVAKTPSETWAVIQDPEKLAEWLPGFIKIEPISGTPGTEGAVALVYFEDDGQNMTIKETITAIEPNKYMASLYESDFMNMEYKLSIYAVDGDTKIISNTSAEGNGIMAKSLLAFMGNSLKKQEESNLLNLKKAIEQNAKNYF